MQLTGPKETIKRAQSLRRAMSLPERVLWRALRKQQTGLRFRRQHPAGPYVLDFYCHEVRLCVEIDGEAHDFRARQDGTRDRSLERHGVRTLRVGAGDVLNNLEGVVQHLCRRGRCPIRRFAAPPPEGEGRELIHRFALVSWTKKRFLLAFMTSS